MKANKENSVSVTAGVVECELQRVIPTAPLLCSFSPICKENIITVFCFPVEESRSNVQNCI